MQKRKHFSRSSQAAAAVLMFTVATLATAQEVYDTSFAVEYSYSCLTGGCHENDAQLVDEYSQSYMTHTMVKCNACHGTHTADTVGQEKPNLTGYQPGIGATGYIVGKDRCLTCHTAALAQSSHPSNPGECLSCHAPHVFAAQGN
ncbi:hypothetical protein [Thiohalomonas denitrificans]|uniref:hypothetical protein n=1 Tax=Thiohalomonas denitrificans TaxID=415747 RepID=UPI0026F2FEAF|nr:hypothetical protein [Thiohalomonas denitrificans]